VNALAHWLSRPGVLRVVRIGIGGVFLAAALGKIGDPAWFALQVHNFHAAPGWAENAIAIVLPWIELLAGLALVLDLRARAGAAIVLALMVVFTVAVAAAWARGLDFRCGCFGKLDASTIGLRKLAENVALTAVAALATRHARPSSDRGESSVSA
jgi:uncharacterized membrane protein YphA (DoxX/SURF4 family)